MQSTSLPKLAHRSATLRDVPLLARLNRQLVEDEGARTRLTLDGLEARMSGWLQGEYAATLFELGGEPVAYALYRKFDGGTHLRQFFVARHARRRGIGRRAIELLLKRVLAAEATIELGVLAHNRSALDFWKAVGFAEYVITLEKLRRPFVASCQALIALGSNLGDSHATVLAAMDALDRLSALPLRRSSLWESAPVDCPPGSPMFVNAAVALEPTADETPESLLEKLQALERQFGRHPKKVLNEPRRLDLDLIAFGREVRSTRTFTLPHPRAHLRRFVLAPLNEVAPDFVLPGQRRTIRALLKAQGAGGAVRRVR
jgi:2-amino-4-hydroxy-6-hydroxymethyldihydropteridine diphosphokinase